MSITGKPVLDVLAHREASRRPVWLMRQAGRYLPEYRELRSKAKNFLNMCLTPGLATEITLQPIRRFDFDAAILFADILLVPYALGQKLEFREGEGPVLETHDENIFLEKLLYDQNKLTPIYETLRLVKKELPQHTTLIGFCGSPWTVACYMIDGTSKNNFKRAMGWAKEKPHLLEKLMDIIIDASEDYLSSQIEAGAEALQLFDSWAGLLTEDDFDKWIIGPTQKLTSRIKKKYEHVPIIGFPREARENYLSYTIKAGTDAVSIDQHVGLISARDKLQPIKPLQGNLSPEVLVEGGGRMRDALKEIMEKMGKGHIINLGHGVVPETPVEHVADLVKFVREFEDQTRP